jgi:hypothetical protein
MPSASKAAHPVTARAPDARVARMSDAAVGREEHLVRLGLGLGLGLVSGLVSGLGLGVRSA